jgi:hypothetical protein
VRYAAKRPRRSTRRHGTGRSSYSTRRERTTLRATRLRRFDGCGSSRSMGAVLGEALGTGRAKHRVMTSVELLARITPENGGHVPHILNQHAKRQCALSNLPHLDVCSPTASSLASRLPARSACSDAQRTCPLSLRADGAQRTPYCTADTGRSTVVLAPRFQASEEAGKE